MTRRILHILSQRPSHTGSGTTLDAIVRQADAAGYEQHVIAGVPLDDPSPQVGELPAGQIHPLVFGRPPLDFPLPGMSDVMPYPSSRFSELSDEQVYAYRRTWRAHVQEVVQRVQPDLIHSHHIWLLSGMIRDVVPRTPIVTHCHGTGLRQLQKCPQFAGKVLSGCRRNDHFFALHAEQAEQMSTLLNLPADRVSVVGAGYREDIFHATGRHESANMSLVYAGKLSNAKGVPQLLDAIAQLRDEFPNMHLHIAGSGTGDEADAIVRRIEQLKENVTWHGQLSPIQLAELLRASRLFVLPSFYEGLPLVVVEAIACGCRVVATDLPGARQIAAELSDVVELVPTPAMDSVDQPHASSLPDFRRNLAAALAKALNQPSAENTSQRASALGWREVFRRIENVWQRLLQES